MTTQFVFRKYKQKGQIIVEYILLLAVATTLSVALIKFVVDINPDNRGYIPQYWEKMLKAVGKDIST